MLIFQPWTEVTFLRQENDNILHMFVKTSQILSGKKIDAIKYNSWKSFVRHETPLKKLVCFLRVGLKLQTETELKHATEEKPEPAPPVARIQ